MNEELPQERKLKKCKLPLRCKLCGKPLPYYIHPDYAWKLYDKYYCSYTCMRTVEKRVQAKEQERIAKSEAKKAARRKYKKRKDSL